ncbi:MAG: hypothetical protein ACFCUV_05965 [Rivularia sp. (in: cyanobacteria)]
MTFNEILNELEFLKPEELQQLYQAIQERLEAKKNTQKNTFHQALLTSGLVKELKQPFNNQQQQRKLIQIQSKPVSETIIEERR